MQDAASHYNIHQLTHPKTLMRYGLIAWTRVSANSETRKGVTPEWSVRLGQRLQLRFGNSGAARELGLVQIVVEASKIREGFSNTNPHYSVVWFWLALSQRFSGTMVRCCPFERRAINYTFLRKWRVLDTHEIMARRSAGQPLFVDCGCCSEPSPEGVLEGGF